MPGPEHGAQARGLAEEQDERATLGKRLFLSVSLSLSVAGTLKFRFPEITGILAHAAEIFSNRRSISAVPSAI